jgi:hypothetical protein
MKSICLIPLILLFFISVNVLSSNRFPLNSTAIWKVDHIRNGVSDEEKHESGDDISKYFFSGDTIINSTNYYKLFKTGVSYFDTPFYYQNVYIGAIRDDNNKFWFVGKKETSEVLLYNFNAKVNDTIKVPYEGTFETKIVSSIDTMFDGRRLIHFNPKEPIMGCGDQYIIEGIGGSGGLIEGPSCDHFWTSDNHLVCYVQDSMLVYHDNNFQFNCDIIKPVDSFIDSTCVWRVDKQSETDSVADFEKLIYFINGDSTIGANHYFRLYKSGYQLLIHDNGNYFSGYNDSVYMGALREQNNELFFLEKGVTREKLLFNFNQKAGEVIEGNIYHGDTVKTIGQILDNRKVFYLSDNSWEKFIIQGIGSDKGLLESGDEHSLLICFMKDKASLYHSGNGNECLLTYDDLSFNSSDHIKVIPSKPNDNENVKLVIRLCYPVYADNPIVPVLSSCKYHLEDNSFTIQLTCDYNDQNKQSDTKILVPVFDTIQAGKLQAGFYSVDVNVSTNHHGTESDTTIEGDKYLYSYFTVSKGNGIITPRAFDGIKVYQLTSDRHIFIENLNTNLDIQSVSVYNLAGERMQVITIPSGTDQKMISIDMASYQNGVYLLQIDGNGLNLIKKIILK